MDLVKHFMNDFKPSYLRNNRRGGQKNIRCFPACSHDGHKCAGFCGQAVKLDVTSTNTTSNIVAVAEFVQLQTNVPQTKTTAGTKKAAKKKATKKANAGTPQVLPIKVGTTVPLQYLHENVRIKKDPLRRFINGNKVHEDIVLKSNTSSFAYEFLPTCWHYSWRSNKHSTNKQHCLRVYLFQQQEEAMDTMMKCIDVFDSPSFSLFSSKQLDNYAKEGKIPNGAIALFHARQKASAEKLMHKINGTKPVSAASKKRKANKRKASAVANAKTKIRLSTKKQKIMKQEDDVVVSFPYDAMIADCLGIERVSSSLSKDEIMLNPFINKNMATTTTTTNAVAVAPHDELSLDMFDLTPSNLKHSNSFTTLNDLEVEVDDYFTTSFNNINVLKSNMDDGEIHLDYSSETSESSQGSSMFHTSSEDDESESDLDALWY